MKKTILLKFACLFLSILFYIVAGSQQNFQSGYIVDLKADTIIGQINYRNWENNPRRIEFRKGTTLESVFYNPTDIKAFGVADEKYLSEIVTVDKSPYKINELDNSGEFKLVKDTVFLEILSEGSKPVYYLKDREGKVNFLIRGDNGVEPLYYKEYLDNTNGITVQMKNENYKTRLKLYWQECPALGRKIEMMSYTLNDMQKLIKEYYICNGVAPAFQKKKEKNKSEFGVFAGVSLTKLSFGSSAQSIYEIVDTDFPQSTSFTGGIFFNIYLSRNLNKLSLNNELIYSNYKTDGVYEVHPNANTSRVVTTNFAFSYLKISTLFRYKYPLKDAAIYLTGGMGNGLVVSETNHQKEVSKFYTTETVKEGLALNSTRKYEQSYIIGLGTKYRNYSLEARFENGNGMSDYSNLRSTAKRIFFIIGYSF